MLRKSCLTQIAAHEELISTDSEGYFFLKIDLCTTNQLYFLTAIGYVVFSNETDMF
jgi:hypothetical protein